MRSSVRIEGMNRLRARLRELEKDVSGELMTQALEAAAEVVREEAEAKAPKGETGILATSFVTEVVGERGAGGKYQAEAGTVKMGTRHRAFYGYFHELGTSKMAAKPFLRPAIEAKKGEAVEAARQVLARGLAK